MSKRILARYGFRSVLAVNAVVSTLISASCGLFEATTPRAVILAVLLVGGCMRSLQFTSLNAISYADASQREMSQATSIASVCQQLSVSLGVTVGAYALQLTNYLRGGGALMVIDFTSRSGSSGPSRCPRRSISSACRATPGPSWRVGRPRARS